MSRKHNPLLLYRLPISGDWQAVRVAKDGSTITDKFPIDNMRTALEHYLSNSALVAELREDMQNTFPGFKIVNTTVLENAIQLTLMDAVKKITEDQDELQRA